MGIGPISANEYAAMLVELLPPGRAWLALPGSVLRKVLTAASDELVRVGARAVDIANEADPRTSSELLPEFERELSLPSTGTPSERRGKAVARETKRQRFRIVDVKEALAPFLGLAASAVQVIEISRASAIALGADGEKFRFFVYRDPALAGSYVVAEAQSELEKISQSHTQGHVIESKAMICDNIYSICDRDLVGA